MRPEVEHKPCHKPIRAMHSEAFRFVLLLIGAQRETFQRRGDAVQRRREQRLARRRRDRDRRQRWRSSAALVDGSQRNPLVA